MLHTIDFQNLTQIQNNQSLMKEAENEEMKKLLSSLSEGIGLIKSQPDPFFFRTITTFKQKQKQQPNVAIQN